MSEPTYPHLNKFLEGQSHCQLGGAQLKSKQSPIWTSPISVDSTWEVLNLRPQEEENKKFKNKF